MLLADKEEMQISLCPTESGYSVFKSTSSNQAFELGQWSTKFTEKNYDHLYQWTKFLFEFIFHFSPNSKKLIEEWSQEAHFLYNS